MYRLKFGAEIWSGTPSHRSVTKNCICLGTSIKYKVERGERYLPKYRVRSLALQPLSAGNSDEFSQAGNSKTIQPTEINLTSLDSLGSLE